MIFRRSKREQRPRDPLDQLASDTWRAASVARDDPMNGECWVRLDGLLSRSPFPDPLIQAIVRRFAAEAGR